MLFSAAIENINNIFYCSVIITLTTAAALLLALHGVDSGSILTPDHTSTTMTSTTSTITNNNVSTLTAGISGYALSNFGVYQQTSVGLSELSIYTLVTDAISAEPYRKTLIARLYFHHILSLFGSISVSFNDLMTIVASYFDINAASAKREIETAAQSNSRSLFDVSNLTGVAFSDAFGNYYGSVLRFSPYRCHLFYISF